jgi:hypothetical protein
MNILYITNHIKISQASGGFVSDYQNDQEKYYILLDKVFEHTKQHLTTKSLAKYILSHV